MEDIDRISPEDYFSVTMGTSHFQSIRSLRQAGAALKARRRGCNMTQQQLAQSSGTAQSTISDIETGVVSVSLEVYIRLLAALDADLCLADRLVDKDLD